MGNKIKFSPMGNDLFGNPNQQDTSSVLKQKFLFAPFSVLNSREGLWQDRKAAWLGLGIQSEVGRGGNKLNHNTDHYDKDHYKKKNTAKAFGPESLIKNGFREGSENFDHDKWASENNISEEKILEWMKSSPGRVSRHNVIEQMARMNTGWTSGTSIFDPVLCELCYEWFCPPKGQILDPFCGGSVRGIVAAKTGRKYWGGDLRPEQIGANNDQCKRICPELFPTYICGDSLETVPLHAPAADMIFSCPPYFDLEVYSEDGRDLSTMSWDKFLEAYWEIISLSCERLKENRFACFVVGDIRDKNGNYRDFVGETIRAFRAAGLHFYNDMILVNAVGTLALRVTRQFDAGRKVGKSHQNVLVFVKGDGKKAAQAIVSPVPSRPAK